MKRHAFTLIELLVVILVIVVLTSMLLPVLTTARQQSYVTECASNLRQLTQATLLYANDHDEYFPIGISVTRSNNAQCIRTVWSNLQPYIRNNKIFLCRANAMPTQLNGLATTPSVGIAPCSYEPEMVSLVPNWCLMVNSWVYPHASAVNLADLPYHANTGFWSDAWFISGDDDRFEPVGLVDARHTLSRSVPDRVMAGTETYWQGRVQSAYVDGHVQNHPTRLRADAYRQGDFSHLVLRPQTVDGRRVPVWFIQGGTYHGKSAFYGWPSRPSDHDPTRMLFRCYSRTNYCDEW